MNPPAPQLAPHTLHTPCIRCNVCIVTGTNVHVRCGGLGVMHEHCEFARQCTTWRRSGGPRTGRWPLGTASCEPKLLVPQDLTRRWCEPSALGSVTAPKIGRA